VCVLSVCVCDCSVYFLSGDAAALPGRRGADGGPQHHGPLLPRLPVWSEDTHTHTHTHTHFVQSGYLKKNVMINTHQFFIKIKKQVPQKSRPVCVCVCVCVCAVCEPSRCPVLVCAVGMSVASVSGPASCCQNQTCGTTLK